MLLLCIVQILASSVDFWDKSPQLMEEMHKYRVYPPSVKIGLNPISVHQVASFTLQSVLRGCRTEDKLDVEFILRLGMCTYNGV